jgi:hypothetical protein
VDTGLLHYGTGNHTGSTGITEKGWGEEEERGDKGGRREDGIGEGRRRVWGREDGIGRMG